MAGQARILITSDAASECHIQVEHCLNLTHALALVEAARALLKEMQAKQEQGDVVPTTVTAVTTNGAMVH